jgi:tetratricopeptide (TPR) repeat protein
MREEFANTDLEHERAELFAALERAREAPDDPGALSRAGCLLAHGKLWEEALPYLKRAVELDPAESEAWYALALSGFHSGDAHLAVQAKHHFSAAAPGDPKGLARRANLHRLAGEPERASELAQEALALEPEPRERSYLHWVLSRSADAAGDCTGQVRHAEEALRLAPEHLPLVEEMAFVYFQQGSYQAAHPHLERLVEAKPDDAQAWYMLGWAAVEAALWQQAREALEKAIELGHDTRSSRESLARALLELGQPAAALTQYQSLLEADPQNADAYQGIGASLARMGDLPGALAHLDEAALLDPDNPERWYLLGYAALNHAGDPDRAREPLERAVALRHPGGRALAQLAAIAQHQGRPRAAVEYARKALKKRLPKDWRPWVDGIIRDCTRRR